MTARYGVISYNTRCENPNLKNPLFHLDKGDVGFHSEASAVPEEAFSATAFSDSDGFSQKLLLQHQ